VPRLVPKHPLVIRVTHWANVLVLGVMAYSGLLIYWANDVYAVRLGGWELVKFFPQWVYDRLDLANGLAAGMAWHFAFAWLFAVNGLVYVGYLVWSGEWRFIVPGRGSVRHAWHTVLHDLRVRKAPPPPAKFNGAQRFAYTGVVVMGALAVLSGLAILKPVQLGWLTGLFGGYQTARGVHFALTIAFGLFVVVHVAQVAKAGWNNFRAMVSGYEVEHPAPEERREPRTPAPATPAAVPAASSGPTATTAPPC
jgi:thiosulfate reductase cytochrome b subunit